MNIIFLRGAVPPAKEHPEKLKYSNIENCEDMWTQLFYYISKRLDAKAEVLYSGKTKIAFVDGNFSEKWVNLKTYSPAFKPDLIICRGGFDYYLDFIKRFKHAKKIYYGAGKRFYPLGYNKYDLFFVDSPVQRNYILNKHKNVSLFIKPASTIFSPVKCEKKYDVCFVANSTQKSIKRHDLLINAANKLSLKTMIIGNTDKSLINKHKNIHWAGWLLRKHLPALISSCKMAVCCSSNYDSCPRVIPEYLACGLPVIVTSNVNFWRSKYITDQTGLCVPEKKLSDGILSCLKGSWSPRDYYKKHLSMSNAADLWVDEISKLFK